MNASANWVRNDSGNGLSPIERQVINWTNADLLSIGTLETNFNEIRIEIHDFSFTKLRVNLSAILPKKMS